MRLSRVGAIAATAVFVFAACSSTGSPAPSGGGAGETPTACQNKKGTSTSAIHVYSSLPRQGTNTAQTNALVESIKQILGTEAAGDQLFVKSASRGRRRVLCSSNLDENQKAGCGK